MQRRFMPHSNFVLLCCVAGLPSSLRAIINCGRGALVDTKALIEGLRSGHVGGAGLDVYENESEFFFNDHSDDVIDDVVLQQLLQFNNVILTAWAGACHFEQIVVL